MLGLKRLPRSRTGIQKPRVAVGLIASPRVAPTTLPPREAAGDCARAVGGAVGLLKAAVGGATGPGDIVDHVTGSVNRGGAADVRGIWAAGRRTGVTYHVDIAERMGDSVGIVVHPAVIHGIVRSQAGHGRYFVRHIAGYGHDGGCGPAPIGDGRPDATGGPPSIPVSPRIPPTYGRSAKKQTKLRPLGPLSIEILPMSCSSWFFRLDRTINSDMSVRFVTDLDRKNGGPVAAANRA